MPVPLSCRASLFNIISRAYRLSGFDKGWYYFIFLGKWVTNSKYFSYFCQQHIMSRSL